MYAKNGFLKLYYEVRGTPGREPLLLIPGLARTSAYWGGLPNELAPDFELVLMDNRGVGKSSTPPPLYTTAQMARDALKVLDAARIDRAHVFGFSLGGMVAQELAIRHPDRVRSLVLGSTRAARRAGMPMTIAAMANLVAAGRFSPAKAMAYTAPYLLSEECRRTRPEVVETWQQLVREQPLRRVGVSGQIFAALAHDSVARLPKIRHRTLILTGDTDRLMPPECSRFLARSIAGAKLEFLKGKGHEFCVEAPRETARAIRDFCLAEEQGENAA